MIALAGIGMIAKALAGKAIANARSDIAAIPPKVKLAIAILVAAIGLYFVHQHYAHRAIGKADQAGYARAKTEDAAAANKLRDHAVELRTHVEGLGVKIAGTLKEEHNAEIARIDSAGAELMRDGPGKARCGLVDAPAAPALHRGQEPVAGTAADRLGQVPDRGGPALIAVPFNDFVRVTGQCDINRDEVLKARANDGQQREAWEKYRNALGRPQ